MLRRLLTRAGYTDVHLVTDERDALDRYATLRPDLVLLDLRMPHVDGFTLLERMRTAMAGDGVTPVLVVSGDPAPESRRRAHMLGASDYVLKPYDLSDITLRVDALLELRAHAHAGFVAVDEMKLTLDPTVVDRPGAAEEVIAKLTVACSFRDGISEGHTMRVARLAGRVAAEMNLPDEWVEAVERCAPLHDIGKVAIPDEILLKPGRLTVEEMAVARRHTSIGAMILSGMNEPLLRLASEIALTHHERWDGAGYPRGLSGDQIPLAGRVVAVADVFDALTHERSYKDAWSVSTALAEIVGLSGKQFDPEAVAALVRVVGDVDDVVFMESDAAAALAA
jgi:putative two-component system response regulator